MKKNIFSTVVLILSVLLVGCSQEKDNRALIKRRSGVTIPTEAVHLYSYAAKGFGHQGHGAHYVVFSFAEEPVTFFTSEFAYGGELYAWSNGKPVYRPVVSGTLHFIDERMPADAENKITVTTTLYKVPAEYTYSWEQGYRYYQESLNTLIYFIEPLILIYFYAGY